MNFSAITVSFPLDQETYEEIQNLCKETAAVDGIQYENMLNLPIAKNYESKGFYVLIYDDAKDALAGVASAVDLMGLNTYEWSMLVAPMYRQLGIGEALYNVMRDGLKARGSEGDLALIVEGSPHGLQFLQAHQYYYSFSEASLEAKAEVCAQQNDLTIRAFNPADAEGLVEIFSNAFGDLRDEALDLIAFNTSTPGLQLWVAEREGTLVGTVTTRKEGEVQWVTALAVSPHYMGQGIGSAILQWVKQYTLHNGEKTVMLDVELDNQQALSVYEKAGFFKSIQVDYFVQKR